MEVHSIQKQQVQDDGTLIIDTFFKQLSSVVKSANEGNALAKLGLDQHSVCIMNDLEGVRYIVRLLTQYLEKCPTEKRESEVVRLKRYFQVQSTHSVLSKEVVKDFLETLV